MSKSETVTAKDIDRMVDEGQDMTAYINMDTLRMPNLDEGHLQGEPRHTAMDHQRSRTRGQASCHQPKRRY